MEKKQTAVEWLIVQIKNDHTQKVLTGLEWMKIFEQAKEMEKEQMIQFAKGFWYYGNGSDAPPAYDSDILKYYNKINKD